MSQANCARERGRDQGMKGETERREGVDESKRANVLEPLIWGHVTVHKSEHKCLMVSLSFSFFK